MVGALVGISAALGIGTAHATGDPARGAALSESCAPCHDSAGAAPIEGYPMLAGQKAKYLIKQLREMRQSAKQRAGMLSENKSSVTRITRTARSNETMDPFVVDLSDQDIEDLAAYYGRLECPQTLNAAPPVPPKVEVRCRICHGRIGISRRSSMPNIAGQDMQYLIKQLKNFRASANDIAPPGDEKRRAPIMEPQAKNLTDSDITALAEYYTRLPCN